MYSNYLNRKIYNPQLTLFDQSNRLKIIKYDFETQASLKKTEGYFLLIDDVVTLGVTLTSPSKTHLDIHK